MKNKKVRLSVRKSLVWVSVYTSDLSKLSLFVGFKLAFVLIISIIVSQLLLHVLVYQKVQCGFYHEAHTNPLLSTVHLFLNLYQ